MEGYGIPLQKPMARFTAFSPEKLITGTVYKIFKEAEHNSNYVSLSKHSSCVNLCILGRSHNRFQIMDWFFFTVANSDLYSSA